MLRCDVDLLAAVTDVEPCQVRPHGFWRESLCQAKSTRIELLGELKGLWGHLEVDMMQTGDQRLGFRTLTSMVTYAAGAGARG